MKKRTPGGVWVVFVIFFVSELTVFLSNIDGFFQFTDRAFHLIHGIDGIGI
jgi:hypothetical protein